MCGWRSSTLPYGPLIETNNMYARRRMGKASESVAKQNQSPTILAFFSYASLSSSMAVGIPLP